MIVRKLNSIPLFYHLSSFSQFACFLYISFGYTAGAATIPEESLILSDWETKPVILIPICFDTSRFDTNTSSEIPPPPPPSEKKKKKN